MKRIVFIVDGYYPKYSAVGVCVNNVIQELSNQYNIIVITKKIFNGDQDATYNNNYVRRYNTSDNYLRNYITEKIELSSGLKKTFFKTASLAVRGYGYVGAILKKINIKNQEVKSIYNELVKIDDKIDIIIPACLPFEGIVAAIKFKNEHSNESKVIPFLFDKFSANSTLHRTESNKRKKFTTHISLERQMFGKCDKILFVESWDKHLHEYFSEYIDKFIQVEHPLIKQVVSNENIVYDHERVNIVYTGALYKKIRSPLSALKLFSKLIEEDKRITLHLYITGDCNSVVNSYSEKYPDNIINHGSVQTDTAKAAIISADILLSIGNSDITQLPSKIFEYISTGNPIMHFYFNKKDPVLTILNDYNNFYCIANDESDMKQMVSMTLKKINNWGDKWTFDEIESIYSIATPKYTAKKIIDLL